VISGTQGCDSTLMSHGSIMRDGVGVSWSDI